MYNFTEDDIDAVQNALRNASEGDLNNTETRGILQDTLEGRVENPNTVNIILKAG